MSEIEIGRNKRGRRSYSFDDVAVVPSRRTRDPEDVSTSWQVDAYHFDIPIFAAPMDSLMSPETAIALGEHGGLGVLDLEGLWTRYEDPTAQFDRIAAASDDEVVAVMREIYGEPVKPELIRDRIQQLRDAGVTAAGSLSPQRTQEHWKTVVDAGVDLFFIRGTTVSAEHVSSDREPLNLKRFIYELDVPVIVGGCATYTAALHLMRTGAAGVLVGFGGGASQTTRETLGIQVPLARAEEAPGRGHHWGSEAHHPTLIRGHRVEVGTAGSLEQILFGPSIAADGATNLVGALRHAMATTGYTDLKEFQRVEVVTTV
jgi:IMP dehydrogenase